MNCEKSAFIVVLIYCSTFLHISAKINKEETYPCPLVKVQNFIKTRKWSYFRPTKFATTEHKVQGPINIDMYRCHFNDFVSILILCHFGFTSATHLTMYRAKQRMITMELS